VNMREGRKSGRPKSVAPGGAEGEPGR